MTSWTPLTRLGVIVVRGADAREFLHGQLTAEIAGLPDRHARRAGWCNAQGRLLATMWVLSLDGEFVLVLSRDLVPAVSKRLRMFVLRAKVEMTDDTDGRAVLGSWSAEATAGESAAVLPAVSVTPVPVESTGDWMSIAAGSGRRILVATRPHYGLPDLPPSHAAGSPAKEEQWELLEIRERIPRLVLATQDKFVPQMLELERLAAVDFKKGCYPGQEVVARTQYRGQLKRRMVRGALRSDAPLEPGAELLVTEAANRQAGIVVNAAPSESGSELLAVVPIELIEQRVPIRATEDGPPIDWLTQA